ncbi:MAG TPA: class I SAM-dependent methyltransferase [Thermoanaerobaculia bacterium]|jgi:SAM-dependent methyltransferase|nr:class I SAM-dependent methyltransferase [Thermoanaerobaculia bacterium]
MPLAFRPDETSPLVLPLLSDLGIAPGTLDLAIDARDEMLGFLGDVFDGDRDRALFGYFRSGASIADSLGQALRWRFGDRFGSPSGNTVKLLDFASGYGRVTRFLVREVPPERVWVADVYADGVRFQEERFGVHGIVSTIRPEDFACAERFDAILVTSLFTHLPDERFVAWLRVLLGLLAPGGMLAFSAHSPQVLPPGTVMPESGIFFAETSESDSLAKSDYGSTWVTEAFVRSALDRAMASAGMRPGASLHRLERGLCNFQDLYLALPEPGVDFSALDFHSEPHLVIEQARLADGGRRLELQGWAAMRSGVAREVEVMLDGERIAAAPVAEPRPDVAAYLAAYGGDDRYLHSGWNVSCPLPAGASRTATVLRLRVVDGRGKVQPLWAGSIEALLLAGSRMEAEKFRNELWQTQALLAEERTRSTPELVALRNRLHAMEASRFWKLRNAWFRVKRGLGLTREA